MTVILFVLALVGIGDGLLFFAFRKIIEPRVRLMYPKLDCSKLAILEILCGFFLIALL